MWVKQCHLHHPSVPKWVVYGIVLPTLDDFDRHSSRGVFLFELPKGNTSAAPKEIVTAWAMPLVTPSN